MEGLSCTHLAINTDVPLQLWEAIMTAGSAGTPIWLVRMLMNKPLYFLLNYLRCYFHYLSPLFISQQTSPFITILLILIVFLVWKRWSVGWKVIKWIILIYPLIFLFELQSKIL